MRFDVEGKHAENELMIRNGRQELIRHYQEALLKHKGEREKWLKRKARCMKVLQESFGDSVLDIVKDELEDQHFRLAWSKPNHHYINVHNGASSLAVVLNRLNAVVYDGNTNYTVHYEMLETLFDQAEAYDDHPLSDNHKLMTLIRSLESSPQKQFEKELTHVKLNIMASKLLKECS